MIDIGWKTRVDLSEESLREKITNSEKKKRKPF